MRAFTASCAERWFTFMRELLRADRGWIKPEDLARECGISRASAYRYLSKLETAGWPLERDFDVTGARKECRGVRSLLVGNQRPHSAAIARATEQGHE